MVNWKKAAVWCVISIALYEFIAFLAGWLIWILFVQNGLFGSRIMIWTEQNSGLLVTGLAGAGAAAVFSFLDVSNLKKGEDLKKESHFTWKDAGCVCVLAVSACIFFNSLLYILPLSSEMAGSYTETGTRIFSGPLPLQIITVCLAAPAGEEGAFRAFLFGRLRKEMGFIASAVISSLMFGIYHGNMIQGIYGFFLGLLLCLVREIYGTMKAPLLMHIAANGVSAAVMGSGIYAGMEENTAVVWCLCSCCILAGAAVCAVRNKK